MKNINFDNPYLLLFLIPAVLLILLPYFFAVGKSNKNWHVTTALSLHLAIAALVILAVAGMTYTATITKTEVWFVCDVSHSADENADTIDAYIDRVSASLPSNSETGIIVFGKDQAILTPMGSTPDSVEEARGVDTSATNISDALTYAASLFREDTIRRIVLITDGKETDTQGTDTLIRTIAEITANNIYLDAIYLDDNLKEGTREVQIAGVEYTDTTYLNRIDPLQVLVQSSTDADAILSLYRDGKKVGVDQAVKLAPGYNVVNFSLDNTEEGIFSYEVVLSADKDTSPHNNTYSFIQQVSGRAKMLFISSSKTDLATAEALWGHYTDIDAYINRDAVPYTIEQLCVYDQIVLSNVDVRDLDNVTSFTENLDLVVSKYGKSLLTFGDVNIQNKTDTPLRDLEDMLPIRFGNDNRDAKLYAIVLDTSLSMDNASRLLLAKQAAVQLLSLLEDDDYVTVVSFSGDATTILRPAKLGDKREELAEQILAIRPSQGTFMGKALSDALDLMKPYNFEKKELMLISDGKSYTLESDDPIELSGELAANGIVTSVINPGCKEPISITALTSIARNGGGKYFFVINEDNLTKLMFTDIADDVKETVLEGNYSLTVKRPNDPVMDGVAYPPMIYGFICGEVKNQANTVLLTTHTKGDNTTVEYPIYAWWAYGEGKVSSFTCPLSGAWTQDWAGVDGTALLTNMGTTHIPEVQHRVPYTKDISYDGSHVSVEIVPGVLSPDAKITVSVTLPDGSVLESDLRYDSRRFYHRFPTWQTGAYQVKVTYTYLSFTFEDTFHFHSSYAPEYDSFLSYHPYELHRVMLGNGTVSEDGNLTLLNNQDEIATYVIDFTIPFLALAVILFVVDVAIRKLKWEDIVTLFRPTTKKGGKT